ncbi:MAG: hypothetical protein AAGC83_06285, partial [Pseudomonadota bacterium]
ITVPRADGGASEIQLPMSVQQGRDLVVGIRPEAISDTAFEPDIPSQTMEWPIELLEPTGAETIGILRPQEGGEELVARLSPKTRVTAGEAARLNVDLSAICLFDPNTGDAIWHAASHH